MMALQPYPAYKDSGVDWLGEVPEHWDVRRARFIFAEVDRRSRDGSEQHLSMSQRLGLVPSHLVENRTLVSESYAGGKLCEIGDLVLNRLKAHLGVFALAHYEGIVSPDYTVLRLKTAGRMEFFEQTLRSSGCRTELRIRAKGIVEGFWRLYTDDFNEIRIPVPPDAEQAAIVRFLDYADRRIRRFIRAKERLIELLEEQKQAIIHQAVTGQIDVRTKKPYPAYKDSDVEGLGEVPEHWDVVALRHLATRFGSGITPRGGATIYETKGIPFLRSQNVHCDGLRLEGVARIPHEVHMAMKGTHVKPGDVLLNITGASIGRVCAVSDDLEEANVNQHVCIIRAQRERMLPEFAAAFLSTREMQDAIEREQVGASRQGLTLDSVRSFKLFVPTVDEQQQIVDEVTSERDRLAEVARATERQIRLAREYYARLIADVVTGKLDVRQAAASLAEVDRLNAEDACHQLDEMVADAPDAASHPARA